MKRHLILAAALLSLISLTAAAQEKKKAVEKRDGLVITYDKFRDQTLVRTERFDVFMTAGKREFFCSGFFAYIKGADKSSSPIMLAVSPGAASALGSFSESLSKENGGRRTYFDPRSDVILLVNDQRYKLGRVEKDYSLTPSGDVRDSVFIEVPPDVLHAIIAAEKWEMAIGSLEAEFPKRYMGKLRGRFQAFEEEFKKDSATVK